jgi:hypothetical protein
MQRRGLCTGVRCWPSRQQVGGFLVQQSVVPSAAVGRPAPRSIDSALPTTDPCRSIVHYRLPILVPFCTRILTTNWPYIRWILTTIHPFDPNHHRALTRLDASYNSLFGKRDKVGIW